MNPLPSFPWTEPDPKLDVWQPQASRRRVLAWTGGMLGAALLAEGATPRHHLAQDDPLPPLADLLPMTFGAWRGQAASAQQLVSPDVQAVLDRLYDQTLSRFYSHPRLGMVMLAAAYGGDQSDATRAHRPEVCYPAQGFVIGPLDREVLVLDPALPRVELPVRRLQARLGSRHEPLTYWVTVGGLNATSGTEQKWAQLAHGLRGVVPDGLLLRVSSLEREGPKAWPVHNRFIQSLWQAVRPAHRHRVFGRPLDRWWRDA